MFSPPPPTKGSKAPAKTPGWLGQLGFLSAKKSSPSVEAGTNDTGVMNGGGETERFRSGTSSSTTVLDNSSSDVFMSPENTSPGRASGSLSMTNNSTSIAGGADRSRLDFSALSSRTSSSKATATTQSQIVAVDGEQTTLQNMQSPWKSRQQTTGGFSVNLKSPYQGNRSRRSRALNEKAAKPLSFLSSSTRDRTRRYRPQAIGLVGGGRAFGRRFGRAGGECKPEQISQALVQLKDSFLAPQTQENSSNVYAVRGKVQWGSSSRPNRLPRPSQKRQRPVQESHEEGEDNEELGYQEGTSRKRRKKVCFDKETDDGNAVVTSITATSTPFRSTANRKGTPMPTNRFMQSTPDSAGESFFSPSNGEDEQMASPRPQLELPNAAPRLSFPFDKLDSDVPVSVDFSAPKREPFDAVTLDPNAQNFQFEWKKISQVSSEAARSFREKRDYEASRYERPPSPVRDRKEKSTGDDDGVTGRSPKRTRVNQNQEEENVPDWVCEKCRTVNAHDESRCTECGEGRKADPAAASGWGNIFDSHYEGKWKCESCNVFNDNENDKCSACDAPKPGISGTTPSSATAPAPGPAPAGTTSFPFATGNSTPKATEPPKFTFGGKSTPSLPVPSGKPEQSKFSFPTTAASNVSSTPGSGFTFGGAPAPGTSNSGNGGFSFAPSATAPAPAPGGFSFGTKSTTAEDKKEDNSKPTFSFGTPAPSASTPAPAPQTGGFKFGAPSTSDTKSPAAKTPAHAPATEGKNVPLSASAKLFAPMTSSGENGDKKPAGASFLFGATKQAGAGTNDTPAPGKSAEDSNVASAAGAAPAFGGFGQSQTTPAAAPPFNFGASKSEAKPAETSPAPKFSFGSTPAPDGGKNRIPAPFGGTPAPSQSTKKSDKKPKRQRGYDLSGAKSVEPKGTTPAPTMFGAPPPGPAAGPSGTTFSFGAAKSDKAAGSTMGSEPAPAAPFGNPAPAPPGGMQFGSTAGPAPAPAASKPFTFGATAPTPAPAAGGFGASSTPAPGAPMFGSGTAAPAFGAAPAPAASGFGSTPAAPAFGGPTSAGAPGPPGGFGSTPAPPGGMNFGSTPAPAPSAGAMNFGSTPAPAPTGGFGSTPAPPAPAPGGFGSGFSTGFGSKPPSATPGAPPFGATPNPPATGFGNAPAFGVQAPAPSSQGFNSAAFGNNAAPNPGGFGGATPAPTTGFGANSFGAPQTGGFQSTTTPAASGGFGFGNAPQTAPPGGGGGGFSIGTTGNKPKGRRVVRAKRPTRPA